MLSISRDAYKILSDFLYNSFVIRVSRDWAAVYKPPGRETVSMDGGPDLLAPARRLLGDGWLAPAHRLDRDTSGIQIFARNAAAEKRLTDCFRRREVEKEYVALCLGVPRNASGTINRRLSEWRGGRRPVRTVREGGLEASTIYRVLAGARDALPGGLGLSLLSFSPKQGRTHQIRVHAAALGHPVLGDDQYGDRIANRLAKTAFALERQALHCLRMAFSWDGEDIRLVCPLAPDMVRAGQAAFGDEALAPLAD